MVIIIIVLVIQSLAIIYLLFRIANPKDRSFIIKDGQSLIFEGSNGTMIIKNIDGSLITGKRQDNIIIEKSTI